MLSLLLNQPAGGSSPFLQSQSFGFGGAPQVTMTGVTAGSTLLLIFFQDSQPSGNFNGGVPLVQSDSSGDTWPTTATAKIDDPSTSSGTVILALPNATAGTHTISIYTGASYGGSAETFLVEVAGVLSAPVDSAVTATFDQTGAQPHTGTSGTPSQAQTLLIGTYQYPNGTSAPSSVAEGSGWSDGVPGSVINNGGGIFYKILSSAAPTGITWTSSPAVTDALLTITGFAMQPVGVSLTPGTATPSFSGYAPTIAQPQGLTPGVASLTFTSYAPTLAQTQTLLPGQATLAYSGFAPSISQPQALNPGPANLTFTGYPPSIAQPQALTPGPAVVNFSGYAPAVTRGSGQIDDSRGGIDPDEPRITQGLPRVKNKGKLPEWLGTQFEREPEVNSEPEKPQEIARPVQKNGTIHAQLAISAQRVLELQAELLALQTIQQQADQAQREQLIAQLEIQLAHAKRMQQDEEAAMVLLLL